MQDEKAALEAEARSLIQFAAKLETQSSDLAANSAALEALKHDFEKQRAQHSTEAAHVKSLGLQAEENQRQLDVVKQTLDHERVSVAQERSVLAQVRLEYSKIGWRLDYTRASQCHTGALSARAGAIIVAVRQTHAHS